MAFDPNNYKQIFEKRFGSGSFDRGLSSAREIGRTQAQVEFEQDEYKRRMSEAKKAYEKAQKEAEKAEKEQAKYEAKQAQQEYYKKTYGTYDDYAGKEMNRVYSKKNQIKMEAERKARTIFFDDEPKKKKDSKKKESSKKKDKKKDDGGLFGDIKKTAKTFGQFVNPFDDVTMKEALKKESKRKRNDTTKKVNKSVSKTVDIINRPGDALRTGLETKAKGGNFYKGFADGLSGKREVSGKELNKALGFDPANDKKDAQFANLFGKKITSSLPDRFISDSNSKTKLGESALGFGSELAADPLNLIGTGILGKVAGKSAKIPKEFLKPSNPVKEIPKIVEPVEKVASTPSNVEELVDTLKSPNSSRLKSVDDIKSTKKDFEENLAHLRNRLAEEKNKLSDSDLSFEQRELIEGKAHLLERNIESNRKLLKELDDEIYTSANKEIAPTAEKLFENISPAKEPKLIRVESKPDFSMNNDGVIPDTRGHISSKAIKEKTPLPELKNNAYIKTVDNVYRLNQFDKHVESVLGKPLKPSEQTYTLGLNSRGSDMISREVLTKNLLDNKGEVIGDSLKSITAKIPNEKLVDFEDYLINKHAVTRMERGEKVFPDEMKMSPEKSAIKAQEYEARNPEFKQLAAEFQDFRNKIGKAWLVDTGLISQESWEGYLKANPNYVPNRRKFSELEKSNIINSVKRGFGNQSSPVKKATGSQRPIISPIESTIEDVSNFIKAGKRNEVMQNVIKNISRDPDAFKGWAEVVPNAKNPGSLMDTLEKKLNDEGLDAVLEEFNKAFDQKPDLTNGNIVSGLVDGQRVHVKVNDPQLLDSLVNLDPPTQDVILRGIGWVTRAMKTLTTGLNPVFSLTRNVFRDIPTAYANSKTVDNPIKYSVDLVKALKDVMTQNESYQAYKNIGGGHASPIASDVDLLGQSKRQILPRQKGLWNTTKHVANKGLDALENLNNYVEAAPRLAEFNRIAKKGDYDSKVKALYEANDITVNFNKYGNVTKSLDTFVPYMNAAVQGLDKTARAIKDGKGKFIMKGMVGVTLPTIGLYAINHNNPDYQKVSHHIRDQFHLIPNGDGTFTRIPKPRELGVFFGSNVERALELMKTEDPEAFKGFMNTVLMSFMPPTRTTLAPFSDVRANKNYADIPIVPGDLARLSPENQFDSRTSEPAKFLGKVFNQSPKQLDYLAQSYGGILADLGVPATTKDGSVLETLKRQVTVDPVFSNDIMGEFYDKKTKLDTASSDFRVTGEKSKDFNETLRKIFGKASRDMSDIRKEIKTVQKDEDMSRKERQKKLRDLQELLNSVGERANKYK
jgi:Large polyvalent protein associated domain 38